MRWQRTVTVVGAHAEGEIGRVIVGGVLPPPGKTMFERMKHLETKADELRQMLLFDPRGGVTVSMNLILPPCHPEADVGLIVMESQFYVPMSGSNTICAVTVLLETGMVPMTEPETRLTLDTPGGLVRVVASCRNGKCERVTFRNVPCFTLHLDRHVEVAGLGTLKVDAAYGGMMYVIVDAAALGFEIKRSEARELVAVGERIKAAAAKQLPSVHPENPEIHTINQTLFAGPLAEAPGGGKTARSAVVVSPGRLDRSPCGTGTSARLAVLHAKGLIKEGETLDHVSIIDSHFIGCIVETTRAGSLPAIITTISGRAWLTGVAQYGVDPDDPYPCGYTLSDTWFA
ncbi:MAG TPA: proline racemase family protein [Stellaceae bacterium]|nr:proline racemase family protein [Stellaceae bacterium]